MQILGRRYNITSAKDLAEGMSRLNSYLARPPHPAPHGRNQPRNLVELNGIEPSTS
jgi:hypothetical protein